MLLDTKLVILKTVYTTPNKIDIITNKTRKLKKKSTFTVIIKKRKHKRLENKTAKKRGNLK